MAELRWSEPPMLDHRGGADALVDLGGSKKVRAELVSRHGEWALVRERMQKSTAITWAASVRRGKSKLGNDIDAVARPLGSAYGVWVRYIGEEKQ